MNGYAPPHMQTVTEYLPRILDHVEYSNNGNYMIGVGNIGNDIDKDIILINVIF